MTLVTMILSGSNKDSMVIIVAIVTRATIGTMRMTLIVVRTRMPSNLEE